MMGLYAALGGVLIVIYFACTVIMGLYVGLGGVLIVIYYACTVMMGLYVALGGVLFHAWEDWDIVSASYFSFVTLATIGGS